MRRGELVESADVQTLFSDPQHDYTKELLAAAVDLDVRS
jgi:ABC-type dipeptide/oligopeptide/nickel transport system ATPase component